MTESIKTTAVPFNAVADEAAIIADAYRGGMRLFAAGVCLITASSNNEPGGMIATAVTSVSAEPDSATHHAEVVHQLSPADAAGSDRGRWS